MNQYVTGNAIKTLREKRKLTQKQLADKLCVSDKTVSKWETGRGLPDITLVEPLAQALSVSVSELLTGQFAENRNRAGNMLKTGFYVCPLCGNVITAAGAGVYSCCGITLPELGADEPDATHEVSVQRDGCEWYVTSNHQMERDHYLAFAAFVTTDRIQLLKMYPEQDAQARFSICGPGYLYYYCNRHGLYKMHVK